MADTTPHPPPGTIDVIVDPASPTASNSFGQPAPAPTSTSATPAQAPYRLRGPRRRWTIILGITTTTLITTLSLTLLYFKWYRTVEYNAMIVVQGDSSFDGTIAVVGGPALGKLELTDRFSASKNYMLRFHVPPGFYRVVIRSPDGKTALRTEYLEEELKSHQPKRVTFPPLASTTRPTSSTRESLPRPDHQ